MAGTRAQSCDRYGSGTLHPGQVLGGSLPLLSPENTLNFKKFINCTFSQELAKLNHLKIHVVIFNKQGIKPHYEFLLLTELGFGKMTPVFATTCSAFIHPPYQTCTPGSFPGDKREQLEADK